MSRRHLISTWLPVAFWLLVIAIESTESMSSGSTAAFLARLLRALHINWDVDLVNTVLRKTGHVIGFGILFLLLQRAFRRSFDRNPWALDVYAVALTVLVAAADEVHQYFLSSRTGRFQDVLIDACGIAICWTAQALFTRRSSVATT